MQYFKGRQLKFILIDIKKKLITLLEFEEIQLIVFLFSLFKFRIR